MKLLPEVGMGEKIENVPRINPHTPIKILTRTQKQMYPVKALHSSGVSLPGRAKMNLDVAHPWLRHPAGWPAQFPPIEWQEPVATVLRKKNMNRIQRAGATMLAAKQLLSQCFLPG